MSHQPIYVWRCVCMWVWYLFAKAQKADGVSSAPQTTSAVHTTGPVWTHKHTAQITWHNLRDRNGGMVNAELTGWVFLWSQPWWRSRLPDTHNTNSRSYRWQTLQKHTVTWINTITTSEIYVVSQWFILHRKQKTRTKDTKMCSLNMNSAFAHIVHTWTKRNRSPKQWERKLCEIKVHSEYFCAASGVVSTERVQTWPKSRHHIPHCDLSPDTEYNT